MDKGELLKSVYNKHFYGGCDEEPGKGITEAMDDYGQQLLTKKEEEIAVLNEKLDVAKTIIRKTLDNQRIFIMDVQDRQIMEEILRRLNSLSWEK